MIKQTFIFDTGRFYSSTVFDLMSSQDKLEEFVEREAKRIIKKKAESELVEDAIIDTDEGI